MHGDLKAILYSALLIFSCVAVAAVIIKTKAFGPLTSEVARKIVHIGVCNWYFIWRYSFESDVLAILGLLTAAVANTFVTLKSGNKRWGLTYYPLSIILIIVCVVYLKAGTYTAAGVAILGMGYGDGLAALFGRLCTQKKIKGLERTIPHSQGKSAGGSLAFIIAVTVIASTFGFPIHFALLIALAGALCEAYTPYGLDNFTVPGVLFIISTLLEKL